MTATTAPRNILRDMIDQDVIRAGDALVFQFKSHVFRCVVTAQGFRRTRRRGAAPAVVADNAAAHIRVARTLEPDGLGRHHIQEIYHEYVTRFSS